MIVGLLIMSVIFGGVCGITAFFMGIGLLQSLIVYAVAGQIPFVLLPLLLPLLGGLPQDGEPYRATFDPAFAGDSAGR